MNSMISLFIDDELTIDEKKTFIEKVRDDTSFYKESSQMLQQEMLIRSDVLEDALRTDIELPQKSWIVIMKNLLRPTVLVPAAMACIIIFLLFMPLKTTFKPDYPSRFVVYQPDVGKVEIAGSFTEWKRVPLKKISNSGYWEAMLKLPEGEHRYTYILEGETPYADPTVLTMEKDDFGGVNSVIQVESRA